MSLSSVQAFFQSLQLDIPILETEANTATVALAAVAHGVEPGRIAKTLAFRLSDGRDGLVVARGDARIDNAKFKTALGKGKMLSPEVVAAAAAGSHTERLKSCGKVTSNTLVAILDDDGKSVAMGERGEICCRGPLVTPGYFEKPEETQEARKFGWHHTGDVGYLDKYGYLYIVDRKKDMIITGGFNVFATEVEAPILAMPEVLECAVIGVPDEKWGESIKAVVVLKAGENLSADEIMERCRARIGAMKAPKSVELWDAIPKTAVGKTDKKVIRAKYRADADRAGN